MIIELIKKSCYLVSVDNYILTAKNEAIIAKFLKSSENNLIITFSITVFRENEMSEQISAVIKTFLQL